MLNPASSPPLIQHFCQVIPAGTLLSLETPSQAKALVIEMGQQLNKPTSRYFYLLVPLTSLFFYGAFSSFEV